MPKQAWLARNNAYVEGTQIVRCKCTRNEKPRNVQIGETIYVYVVFLFLIKGFCHIKSFEGMKTVIASRGRHALHEALKAFRGL